MRGRRRRSRYFQQALRTRNSSAPLARRPCRRPWPVVYAVRRPFTPENLGRSTWPPGCAVRRASAVKLYRPFAGPSLAYRIHGEGLSAGLFQGSHSMKVVRLSTYRVAPRWCFLKMERNAGVVGLGRSPSSKGGAAPHGRSGGCMELSGVCDRARIPAAQSTICGRPLYRRRPSIEEGADLDEARSPGIDQAFVGYQGQGLGCARVSAAGRSGARLSDEDLQLGSAVTVRAEIIAGLFATSWTRGPSTRSSSTARKSWRSSIPRAARSTPRLPK